MYVPQSDDKFPRVSNQSSVPTRRSLGLQLKIGRSGVEDFLRRPLLRYRELDDGPGAVNRVSGRLDAYRTGQPALQWRRRRINVTPLRPAKGRPQPSRRDPRLCPLSFAASPFPGFVLDVADLDAFLHHGTPPPSVDSGSAQAARLRLNASLGDAKKRLGSSKITSPVHHTANSASRTGTSNSESSSIGSGEPGIESAPTSCRLARYPALTRPRCANKAWSTLLIHVGTGSLLDLLSDVDGHALEGILHELCVRQLTTRATSAYTSTSPSVRRLQPALQKHSVPRRSSSPRSFSYLTQGRLGRPSSAHGSASS